MSLLRMLYKVMASVIRIVLPVPTNSSRANCQSHRVSQARPRCVPAPADTAAAVLEPLYDLESVQDSVDDHQVRHSANHRNRQRNNGF